MAAASETLRTFELMKDLEKRSRLVTQYVAWGSQGMFRWIGAGRQSLTPELKAVTGIGAKSDGDPVIPEVFKRMPIEMLRRYAQHGVVGAKQELSRRQAEQAKPPAPRSETQ